MLLYYVFEILLLGIKFMINFLQRPVTVLVFFILIIQGCASTQQRRDVEEVGFLGNSSSLLEKGKDGQVLREYINPNADWRSYTKVILEPVTIWKDKETEDVSPEDLQTLANFLHGHLYDTLDKDYTIVQQAGPGVMRATFAITEAEASAPVMDTITSIIPQTRILTGIKGLIVGGKPGFVGSASIEMKLTDAQTGTLLLAGVDRRGGTKDLSGMTKKWNDVEKAYIYWVGLLRYRLCDLRGGTDCVEPKA